MIIKALYLSILNLVIQLTLYFSFRFKISYADQAIFLTSFTIMLVCAYALYDARRPWNKKSGEGAVANRALRHFFYGFIFGALIATAIFATTAALHGYALRPYFFCMPLAGYALMLSASAAAFEEICFRGILLGLCIRWLPKAVNIPVAIIFQALLFAYAHMRAEKIDAIFISALLVAILLAVLALQTKALWMSMGFHCAFNFLSQIAMGINKKRAPGYSGILELNGSHLVYRPIWLALATAGVIGVALYQHRQHREKSQGLRLTAAVLP